LFLIVVLKWLYYQNWHFIKKKKHLRGFAPEPTLKVVAVANRWQRVEDLIASVLNPILPAPEADILPRVPSGRCIYTNQQNTTLLARILFVLGNIKLLAT